MYAHQCYDIHGNEMSQEAYDKYFPGLIPNKADYARLNDIMKDNDWIEHRTSQN